MNRLSAARLAAIAGLIGSVAFIGTLVLEVAGTGTSLAEGLAYAGFLGFAALALALLLARAGGGIFGTVALGLWIAGSLSLFTGSLVEAATGNADNAFFPVGGLSTALGGLLAAIAVYRAGVLTGWRKWTLPAMAAFYLGLLVLNIANGDNWDQPLATLGWPLLAIAVAAAILTEPRLTQIGRAHV